MSSPHPAFGTSFAPLRTGSLPRGRERGKGRGTSEPTACAVGHHDAARHGGLTYSTNFRDTALELRYSAPAPLGFQPRRHRSAICNTIPLTVPVSTAAIAAL